MIFVLAALLAVLVPVTVLSARTWGAERTSALLRRLALAVSLVAAVALMGPGWSDSGAFALVLLGVPVVASAVAVLAGPWRFGVPVIWLAAVVQLVWSLLLGLGVGLALLPAALVETAAAVARSLPSRPRV